MTALLLFNWHDVSWFRPNLVVTKAIMDGFGLDFSRPSWNNQLDGLKHVNLLWLVNLGIETLEKETVEAPAVVGLKVADDPLVAWLDLGQGMLSCER